MFINIRGTFGSGKTTVIRSFMETLLSKNGREETLHNMFVATNKDGSKSDVKLIYHRFDGVEGLARPVLFIGGYGPGKTGDLTCGGADTVNWKGAQDDIDVLIRNKIKTNHILIEGSIVSGSYNRYNRLASYIINELGEQAIQLYMMAPLDECIRRVEGRRKNKHERKLERARAEGKEDPILKPFKVDNITKLNYTIERALDKAPEVGVPYKLIDSTPDVGTYIYNLIRSTDGLK